MGRSVKMQNMQTSVCSPPQEKHDPTTCPHCTYHAIRKREMAIQREREREDVEKMKARVFGFCCWCVRFGQKKRV